MKRKLYDVKNDESLLEYGFPEDYSYQEEGVSERVVYRVFNFASGTLHETFFENFHIGYCDLKTKTSTKIPVATEMETIEMEFVLRGSCKRDSSAFENTLDFEENRHNITYTRPHKAISNWKAPSKIVQMLQINISPNVFMGYLTGENNLMRNFKENILKKKSSRINAHSLTITPKMHQTITEIISCKRKGTLKRVFLESKILELLVMQLEQFSSESNPKNYTIKEENIEKIHAAKAYIIKHKYKTVTLAELSQIVCTNEYTLKKGFKEVFGATVFGFWNELKMENAKNLLLDGKISIGDIADKLSYKNQRHFSTAFKKHFGKTPREMRNVKNFTSKN